MDNNTKNTLIVIYNKTINESKACQCLDFFKDINIIIVDNSTRINDNEKIARSRGWRYLNMGGNKGLAKAYNRAIEEINSEDGILCLFDDDTEINKDYFNKLEEISRQEPETDIFLPLVYDEIGLLSPSVIKGLAVKRVNDPKDIPIDKINGINSGMAIRMKVFKDYRYDQKYFLDYIDHAFIRDMKKRNHHMTIFETILKQNFFANSNANVDDVVRRFQIFRKDFKRFCGDSISGRVFYFKEIMERRKEMYLKYRKISMLFF